MDYTKVYNKMMEAKKICIVTHLRPDGDALGSAFAIFHMLKHNNKDVDVTIPSWSKKFDFLEDLRLAKKEINPSEYDLLICTDSSSVERLSINEEEFKAFNNVIVFDHHKFSSIDGEFRIIDETSPAVCEIIYDFMIQNGVTISKEIADCLYMGIMTDTGSFNYERTTAQSYEIASKLITNGADFVNICKWLNDTISESKARLMAYVIEHMYSYFNGYLRISYVSLKTQKKYGIEPEDAEGLTNYLRTIENTEVAVYVREIEPKTYKASIRTNGAFDCSTVANQFGGGGHVRASGFEFINYKKTMNRFIKIVGERLNGENNGDIKHR